MSVFCKMTGDFTISYKGKRLEGFAKNSYKLQHLLAMLLFYRSQGVSRTFLIENLYGQSQESDDPANSLKALIFRLRKQLGTYDLPEQDCILYKKGIYRLNPQLQIETDVQKFDEEVAEAASLPEKEAIISYSNAINCINGSLLPLFSSEIWVIAEEEKLAKKYSDVVKIVSSYYKKNKEYNRQQSLLFRVKAMFPYDENWELEYLNCLVKNGNLKEAQQDYERFIKVLKEEKSVEPSEYLKQSYLQMFRGRDINDDSTQQVIQDLIELKPTKAYHCSFEKFADVFHLLYRIMYREHIKSSLLLCGIKSSELIQEDNFQQQKDQMNSLQQALMDCLRKSDIICSYGQNQMLIFLWNTPQKATEKVIERIEESYRHYSGNQSTLVFLPIDLEKLSFFIDQSQQD